MNPWNIRQAKPEDGERIQCMIYRTIFNIYPKYYPRGAVEFFLHHHSAEKIAADIAANAVYVCECDGKTAGTVTIQQNEILRLFVLPEYQGRGIGSALLNFAEQQIGGHYDSVKLEASLTAREIYHKRGYRGISFARITTENGDFLCYDVMEKAIQARKRDA